LLDEVAMILDFALEDGNLNTFDDILDCTRVEEI
jgi:hypothetical protein